MAQANNSAGKSELNVTFMLILQRCGELCKSLAGGLQLILCLAGAVVAVSAVLCDHMTCCVGEESGGNNNWHYTTLQHTALHYTTLAMLQQLKLHFTTTHHIR